jgi:hypothetical protein
MGHSPYIVVRIYYNPTHWDLIFKYSCVPFIEGTCHVAMSSKNGSLFVKTIAIGYAPTEDGAIETTWHLRFSVRVNATRIKPPSGFQPAKLEEGDFLWESPDRNDPGTLFIWIFTTRERIYNPNDLFLCFCTLKATFRKPITSF